MAANIDTTTGTAAVLVVGEAAWHRMGINVKGSQTSAEVKAACPSLNFPIVEGKVCTILPDGTQVEVVGKKAIVRGDVNKVLSIMGSDYQVFQNEESFDFMDAVVGEGMAAYETAGSLDEGRRIWLMARMPKTLHVGTDEVHPYVLLANSHDGTLALRMLPTSVRVVCQNTLNLALGNKSEGLSIRHHQSLKGKVEQAKKNLSVISGRMDAYQEELNSLAARKVSTDEVSGYFKEVFPVKESKSKNVQVSASLLESIVQNKSQAQEVMADLLAGHAAEESRAAKRNAQVLEMLLNNYENSRNQVGELKDSALALVNAVTEYCDYQMGTRGGNDSERLNNRTNSVLFGAAADKKMEAYGVALKML